MSGSSRFGLFEATEGYGRGLDYRDLRLSRPQVRDVAGSRPRIQGIALCRPREEDGHRERIVVPDQDGGGMLNSRDKNDGGITWPELLPLANELGKGQRGQAAHRGQRGGQRGRAVSARAVGTARTGSVSEGETARRQRGQAMSARAVTVSDGEGRQC